MKKIYEYKVFDILKVPENEKFLSKVKKENPDLYTRFLNLVGNKGLEKAKEMYVDYDPEVVKKREAEEKAEKALLKKLGREEYKKQKNQETLDFLKDQIDEVNKILLLSELRTLSGIMLNNKQIGHFLHGTRTQYKNLFKEKLKKPKDLRWEFSHSIVIDNLRFTLKHWEGKVHDVISINQLYNQTTKELSYSINFNLPNQWDELVLSADNGKETEFTEQRNEYITKLSKSNITKNELFEIIFIKFFNTLNDKVYKKWKEDYIMKKDADKYNI